MTRIKICGITEVPYARAAIKAGADFIGVVFAASPRQVTYDKAREIVTAARAHNRPVVGVFVNQPAAAVNAIASFCELDWVQLSGDETWEYCHQIEKSVIKTIHVAPDWGDSDLLRHLETGQRAIGSRSPLYLLDTSVKQRYGGTGQAFAWEIARQAATEYPVIIAGGLKPGNVGQVVASLDPWGVDVSSGVETKGVKSASKIKAFITAVRQNSD
ncbi:phosphoribosylanthranilate isomerase [Chloroflexota bacterium]